MVVHGDTKQERRTMSAIGVEPRDAGEDARFQRRDRDFRGIKAQARPAFVSSERFIDEREAAIV
jgi:hypothetical protein